MWALLARRAALDIWLRVRVKRRLARAGDPVAERAEFEREAKNFPVPPDARFERDELPRPGPEGPLELLWAWREGTAGEGVVLYLHGGAYFTGSTRTHRHVGALIAGHARARAVLPEYRLAPENPYPAALEDARDAYRHLLDRGHAPGRIALAGDSAGGGLAFALALLLEQEGLPPPAAIVAFSPWSDLTEQAPSLRRNAWRDPMLPAHRFADVVRFYLGSGSSDPRDPLVSPVFGRFRRPPPSLIFACRDEILADDASEMAEALRRSGGHVELEWESRLPHAWPLFAGVLPEADRALARAGAFLADHMER